MVMLVDITRETNITKNDCYVKTKLWKCFLEHPLECRPIFNDFWIYFNIMHILIIMSYCSVPQLVEMECSGETLAVVQKSLQLVTKIQNPLKLENAIVQNALCGLLDCGVRYTF